MTSLSARRSTWPTRQELGDASVWVWVLAGVALVEFSLVLFSGTGTEPQAVSTAALSAAPALVAATLMLVAPAARLIRIAAVGFAVPVVIFAASHLLGDGFPTVNSDYALLIPRLMDWFGTAASIAWAFTAVGVMALALYIGRVKTSRGWAIVGVAALLAVDQLVNVITTWQQFTEQGIDELPLSSFIIRVLAPLLVIASGYLAAVAAERRLWLLATGAAAGLLVRAIDIFALALGPTTGPTDIRFQAVSSIAWIVNVVGWAALLAGIMRELPRTRTALHAPDTDSTMSQEAFSPGQ